MKKGEVTAFLSIIFVLLMSFITTVLNSAILQTSKSIRRQEVDRAMFSIFGEFDPQLFEAYDIFAMDSGGKENTKNTYIEERLHYYGSCDIEHDISGIQYLTDRAGISFREQAIKYMTYIYGISSITDLIGMTKDWEKMEIAGEDIKDKNETITKDISEIAGRENGKENLEPILELQKIPVLSATLPKEFKCSSKILQREDLLMMRKLNTGKGKFYIPANLSNTENELLFREYLLKKFSNALTSAENKENKELSYEIEYMIGGKKSDKDNLEVVLRKIVLLRIGANYTYLLKDAQKKAEAEAMATILSALLLCPEGIEVLCQILLVAWAFSESIIDLKQLMSGNKVPLIKSADQWNISLDSVVHKNVSENTENLQQPKKGLEYKDYLRILLFFKKTDSLTWRALDRIEGNLRKNYNMEDICLDYYMVKLRLDNKATIKSGIQYQFPTYFGYN